MARIRTIKPDFFKHEDLYEAEKETGFPLRVAFAGLWCVADREGRFKWRPRQIKLDVLPYDELDFSRVLDALLTRGFIVKYANGTDVYGCIPTFLEHQVVNNRESHSVLPSIDDEGSQKISSGNGLDALPTREQRVDNASGAPLVSAQGEGKGREGEGKGREGGSAPPASPPTRPENPAGKESETDLQAACRETFRAYASAYWDRYQTEPVVNAKVRAQIKQFCQRLPFAEAPLVAAHYLASQSAFYLRKGHDVGSLLADAEKLRTEWATGRQITEAGARQADRTQTNMNAAEEAVRMLESQGMA